MCYQVVELYSACKCLYYQHAVDRCASFGRPGHRIQQRTIYVGLWLLKWPLPQEVTSALPVKSVVSDDGLLLVALAAVGSVPVRSLGHLPLLFQNTAFITRAATFTALLLIRGLRPSGLDLEAYPRVDITQRARSLMEAIPSERLAARLSSETGGELAGATEQQNEARALFGSRLFSSPAHAPVTTLDVSFASF
ncbi:uncharacterized protein E0L32_006228 [Thyridium curvatum]|uniref:Uncharacterized protein n=1 Tax=Thyridium curvatum TaxID=1093900 RepID=A0A507AQW9_9PEZI|nr:uncharacterized protein E0L32_006228 [Thyridium curvatum]TPX13255.1 hypothetical protein E0L32_006228 [Thyridium curvatum]